MPNSERSQPAARRLLLAMLFLGAAVSPALADEPAGKRRLTVTVQETAGIRRFGYPVTAELHFDPPLRDQEELRLLDNGKPVAAQFTRRRDDNALCRSVTLDFAVSPGPWETHEYVVESGLAASRSAQAKEMVSDPGDSSFHVRYGTELEFVVPKDLLGFLRQVRTPRLEYLRAESPGLVILYRDNIHFRAGGPGPHGKPTVGQVIKNGPLAATLRFQGTEALRGNRTVQSVVTLDFVRTKSWVQATWDVDDPSGFVAGLGLDLNLKLEGQPALIDFGAGTLVYALLRKGEEATLRAGTLGRRAAGQPSWQVSTGPVGKPLPYVVAPPDGKGAAAEGWAHVMDRERCAAVAVKGFADPGQEAEIAADASGRLQIWRRFGRGGSAPPGPKRLTFWLHFVPMPVHVGAATSPQAMLAPLHVSVH
jgi:hypothetical protein